MTQSYQEIIKEAILVRSGISRSYVQAARDFADYIMKKEENAGNKFFVKDDKLWRFCRCGEKIEPQYSCCNSCADGNGP